MSSSSPASQFGPERVARRGDVRAVPRRPVIRGSGVARLLCRLQADAAGDRPDGGAAATAEQPPATGSHGQATDDGPPPRDRARPPKPRRSRRRRAAKPAKATLPSTGKPAPAATPRRPRPVQAGGQGEEGKQLRGAAAAIAKNMELSLTVPTATSVRAVPAKLLADNRIVINNHLQAHAGRQGLLHPPDRLRGGPGAAGVPEHEPALRRDRRQAASWSRRSTSTSVSPSTCRARTAAARWSSRRSRAART